MPEDVFAELRKAIAASGFVLAEGDTATTELNRLRGLYEPYALSMAEYLRLDLPPWIKGGIAKDNWQTTAWQLSQAKDPVKVPVHDEHG